MASLTNAAAYVVAFGLQTLLVFAGNSRFFGLLKEGSGWRTNVEMSVPLRVDTYATPCRSRAVRTGGTGQLALSGARLYVRRTRTRIRRTLAPQVSARARLPFPARVQHTFRRSCASPHSRYCAVVAASTSH